MSAVVAVTDDNQVTINEKGSRLQGPHPGGIRAPRQRSLQRPGQRRGSDQDHRAARPRAQPPGACPTPGRRRSSTPSCSSPDWPRGQPYSATVDFDGRMAYRIRRAGILHTVLPGLPWDAKRRPRHYRLPKRGPQARRPRRRDQHHAVPLRRGLAGGRRGGNAMMARLTIRTRLIRAVERCSSWS